MSQLEQQVQDHLQAAQLEPGATLIVAVSAGVDSMALLHLLERVGQSQFRLVVAHVNHQLRSASVTEERFLRRYCGAHHLPLYVWHWDHGEVKQGMEAQARSARYQFFHRVMDREHAQAVVTAHQQNDQAETVLMKLARSGDVGAVQGIKAQQPFFTGQLLRPLLAVSKQMLVTYARDQHLTWFEDDTNRADGVLRNRIRHHVLPALQRENAQATAHLAQFATNLQRVEQQSELLADRLLDPDRLREDSGGLTYQLTPADQPVLESLLPVLWRRVQKQPLTTAKVQAAQRLILKRSKPQGELDLGQGWQLKKRYQSLRLQKKSANLAENYQAVGPFMVVLNHWYELPGQGQFGVFSPEQRLACVVHTQPMWLTEQQWPLQARSWRTTDRIALPDQHSQRIRRVLINQKVPAEQRNHCLVLETATQFVAALIGFKVSYQAHDVRAHKYLLAIKNERKNDERRYPNHLV
ncbi:tRNA lysidine(34) synthetase TilS [Fructilactobacillus carniphilus]|uniref:tRNA(Ile)-lysidine synthase n=1 Tax=Fructilactobacillus carniphilus TaxID=2940297 RepID=A0ABY5BYE7_9LACO|nr:tRNA lysidine(34) synthetase TilS [Fructilactobacillus carniphilus]USS90136.1 tRNA lysidine(34) synthetase TilS [Fructilactobacillus carniphilus]